MLAEADLLAAEGSKGQRLVWKMRRAARMGCDFLLHFCKNPDITEARHTPLNDLA
jgi:hypothetical protein